MYDLDAELEANAQAIEAALGGLLTVQGIGGLSLDPARLVAAMRHGTLSGGKRLRPLLVRQAAAVFGVKPERTLGAGLAIELVHCYSLIHDDLPAMDNDDLRRGKPTVHKAFDEATAILAGDALLTESFRVLTRSRYVIGADVDALLVAELAEGAASMVGGQMRDIEAEGNPISVEEIAAMQAMKTGALIRAAVRMGAILGEADDEQMDALTAYAESAGEAYQLADDLLDVTASTEELGKATKKDEKAGKQTLVASLGVAQARHRLIEQIDEALAALSGFGPEADGLRATAGYFASREN
jgi:farnesyl diphosphate synthase